ncbi:MAG: FKBP-type peptidyl-prolyl cis-trans isomerase [Thermoplasmata archaeon]|nr:FKBP-type peptidyl-prolyl cis-trans isomerase [Thermoplasmata archaeon]MBE3142143.1 FKBP-type peptidyl-prolyl cis-trans isomerase [Thermoplasmata archaeon]
MKKTMIVIGICLLSTLSLLSGCEDVSKKITPLSIVSFTIEPNTINQGEYANLNWTIVGASSVNIDNGIGNVTPSGNRIIRPTQTTTYILITSNATNTKSATATITITPPLIAIGDCADVNYIERYASNNTIFNSSGGTPLKIFVSYNKSITSPKSGYSADIIEGFLDGLIGMQEGQTKIIGPIPPEKAYGKKLTAGSIFTTQYTAFGMNQTVEVTKYTSEYLSLKWIGMENLGNFTMPQLVINNLQSTNEKEMVIYPPPYYIWENATSIISIADDGVTVRTTPTRSTSLSDVVKDVRYGEKQMLIFPNATTASWDDNTITVTCSPKVGTNYSFETKGNTGMINVIVSVRTITGDKINVSIVNDQSPEPTYLDVYKILTFSRNYVMPREYNNIPPMYISYFYAGDIENAGYSTGPLAGESVTLEVTVEKIYKIIK